MNTQRKEAHTCDERIVECVRMLGFLAGYEHKEDTAILCLLADAQLALLKIEARILQSQIDQQKLAKQMLDAVVSK